jgi:hypothetical protein
VRSLAPTLADPSASGYGGSGGGGAGLTVLLSSETCVFLCFMKSVNKKLSTNTADVRPLVDGVGLAIENSGAGYACRCVRVRIKNITQFARRLVLVTRVGVALVCAGITNSKYTLERRSCFVLSLLQMFVFCERVGRFLRFFQMTQCKGFLMFTNFN